MTNNPRSQHPSITGALFFCSSFLLSFMIAAICWLTLTPQVTQSAVIRTFDVTANGAVTDGTADSTAAIQQAIDAASKVKGTVLIPAGTYRIDGTLKLASNVTIKGASSSTTILQKNGAGNLMTAIGKTARTNITISDMTIDIANQTAATGIMMEYVNKVTIQRCKIINATMWGVYVGVLDGTDSVIRNSSIIVRDSTFTGLAATYEHLLLFNVRGVTVSNTTFQTGASGNGIGIYQNAQTVKVDKSTFSGMKTGIYYSLSTDNITVSNSTFTGNDNGISGANQSDNGAFSRQTVRNVTISKSQFTDNTLGVRLGAVIGGKISDCTFTRNKENALVISQGQTPINAASQNISVMRTKFIENNQVNTVSVLHPGILITGFSSDLKLTISDTVFSDGQTQPTQLYPLAFVGAFQWQNINILRSTLQAYGGAYSIGTSGNPTFAGKFFLQKCQQVSGTLPTHATIK